MEDAAIELGADGLAATSTAFGTIPLAYRLDLELLRVDPGWITRRLALTASGDGWARTLVLERDGSWTGAVTDDGVVPPAVVASAPHERSIPATSRAMCSTSTCSTRRSRTSCRSGASASTRAVPPGRS